MTGLWIIAVLALIVALVALAYARRTARQLAQMTELYWQLKFDHGELKARVAPPAPVEPAAQQTFVPLSRLRSASAPESLGATGSPGEADATREH